jgi:hypothetical protein
VPQDVSFQTKPEIAPDQIRAALAAEVPKGVVLMDAGYGADTGAIEHGLGDHRDGASGRKADVGNQRSEKHSPTRRQRAAGAQISDDRCTDIAFPHPTRCPTMRGFVSDWEAC